MFIIHKSGTKIKDDFFSSHITATGVGMYVSGPSSCHISPLRRTIFPSLWSISHRSRMAVFDLITGNALMAFANTSPPVRKFGAPDNDSPGYKANGSCNGRINFLFNNALNITHICLQLYGIGYILL